MAESDAALVNRMADLQGKLDLALAQISTPPATAPLPSPPMKKVGKVKESFPLSLLNLQPEESGWFQLPPLPLH